MERYICIHGHFYQPPRENPWLEDVEFQESAYPFHDWNERITEECYEPNAMSRILDSQNRIVRIVNNYARISFNVGPTLLAWMERQKPHVYQAILEADRESRELFSGHGSAIAQCYNHMIMPLANRRDKYTQIVWGIRDFEHRFGRHPEGMWLPETAVDLEALDMMAQEGIVFTILEPGQARRIRPPGSSAWEDVSGGRVDSTRAYKVRLPSGKTISVFFYDGPVSRAVAFERLLSNGVHFANRIAGLFNNQRSWPQLAHIATDGETYGHHHRYGDMALAYALHYIESQNIARLTNYGEFLELHPPTHEVQIIENTSWSCAHGIERWRSNCGCNSGMNPAWNQSWRAPLRGSLDWLRDTLIPHFEKLGRTLVRDSWAARDDYISVVLDRSADAIERFIEQHAIRTLKPSEKTTLLKLMEMQRHTMLMYTSCGWFFDELSGIETIQVIQYAERALQLGQELFGNGFEAQFLERLGKAPSNVSAYKDGRHIFVRFVKPTVVDLLKVGAHYAMSSLFENYEEHDKVYCYTVDLQDYRFQTAGRARMALGRARIMSDVTLESVELCFGVLHLGDHNLSGGLRIFNNAETYAQITQEIGETFARADITGVIRMLDSHFASKTYSLQLLFRDQQRKVLNMILDTSLAEAEAAYRQIYEYHAPLMRYLSNLNMPIPRSFQMSAEFALNTDLRRALEAEHLDPENITALLDEAQRAGVTLDKEGLRYTLEHTISRIADQFEEHPLRLTLLQELETAINLVRQLPFEVNLWKTQNVYYKMVQTVYPDLQNRAGRGSKSAQTWLTHFTALGEDLRVRLDG